jgi:hypothetical protein
LGLANADMIISTPDLTEHLIPLTGEPKMANLCLTLNLGFFDHLSEATSSEQPDHFLQVKEGDLSSITISTPAVARSLKDVAALIYTVSAPLATKNCSTAKYR